MLEDAKKRLAALRQKCPKGRSTYVGTNQLVCVGDKVHIEGLHMVGNATAVVRSVNLTRIKDRVRHYTFVGVDMLHVDEGEQKTHPVLDSHLKFVSS